MRPASRDGMPVILLFFVSGFTGLVYQVLWMRELGLLFGSTAQSAGATLAAFFLGLVVGARYWGRKAGSSERPLRLYALLEVGVALAALLYFLLLDAYHAVYGTLFDLFGDASLPFLGAKFLLATGVLFLPSFFMGGTLPAMSQYLVGRERRLGRTVSMLYGVNTLGAAVGACAAGFYLPRYLGFSGSYVLAIATTGVVAAIAWQLDRRATGVAESRSNGSAPEPGAGRSARSPSAAVIGGVAFLSGFGALGLEVLWTRMFAQVLQNSVYTFSIVLVVFLVALALGAVVARRLMDVARLQAGAILGALLGVAGVLIAMTPFIFTRLTDGLEYAGAGEGFAEYVLRSFWMAAVVMLAPGVALGAVFPFLMRLAEPFSRVAGRTVGDLVAINTSGAVVGALASGFILLDVFGLWTSIRFVAVGYLTAAVVLLQAGGAEWPRLARLAIVTGLVVAALALDPSRLPIVRAVDGEQVLGVWESSSGIVSVVQRDGVRAIKLDNDYALGDTAASPEEQAQTHLPMLLHPDPESIFFLGMGTGITAGTALRYPVRRVVVAEIAPGVVTAARTFFAEDVYGLFDDPRARVVAEDGRNYLMGASERFDVIVSDLFMPWKAGVGSLYSLEHYAASRERLRENGLYVQWLPLYQLSRDEFGVVARTMREAFPLVTLWRGIGDPGRATAALIGHRDVEAFESDVVRRRMVEGVASELGYPPSGDRLDPGARAVPALDLLLQYAGNLTSVTRLLDGYRVNTDDRPAIEYTAPIAHRRARSGEMSWFVGRELVEFLGQLMLAVPPGRDPYLAGLSEAELGVVRAGLGRQIVETFDAAGEPERARRAWEQFDRLYRASREAASD